MSSVIRIRIELLITASTIFVSLIVFVVQMHFNQVSHSIEQLRASMIRLEDRIHKLETEIIPKDILLEKYKQL